MALPALLLNRKGKEWMSDTSLKTQVQNDMKEAMRAKDQKRLDVIRLLLAAVKQREVDERISLSDAQMIEVISKMIKQRKESISQYQTAGRDDLIKQENYEIEVVQKYLPAQLSDAEISAAIKEAVAATSASSIKDMGKVMAQVRPQLQGRADMAVVSTKIKELLGG